MCEKNTSLNILKLNDSDIFLFDNNDIVLIALNISLNNKILYNGVAFYMQLWLIFTKNRVFHTQNSLYAEIFLK